MVLGEFNHKAKASKIERGDFMLINCPDCNEYISDTAESCPSCGYDLKSNPGAVECARKRRVREIKKNYKKCGCLPVLIMALVFGTIIKLIF